MGTLRLFGTLAACAVLACGGMRRRRRRAGGRRRGRRSRHRRDDHDVDARGHADAERAPGRGLQREPREPGRADGHPDRQLPGARRRGGRRQEPAGRLRVRRDLRAELHVAGPLPRHHRAHRRARRSPTRSRPRTCGSARSRTRKYAVPHTLDLSVLFYNKDLYKKAGLDPEKPPATLAEFADHARTIREKVGGKTYGTFFGGNCPGCFVFTFWPSVWAGGGDIMNEDGTESTIDDPNMAATFQIYNDLVKDDVVHPGHEGEAGPTWTGLFGKGNIGVMPMPSTTLGLMPEKHGHRRGADPGPGGRRVDVRRRRRGRHRARPRTRPTRRGTSCPGPCPRRRRSRSWPSTRTSSAAPTSPTTSTRRPTRASSTINELVAKGETPYSLNFGATYNDPNGPWLSVARDAVFERRRRRGAGRRASEPLTDVARPAVSAGGGVSSLRARSARRPVHLSLARRRSLKGIGYAAPTALIVGSPLPGAAGARVLDVG